MNKKEIISKTFRLVGSGNNSKDGFSRESFSLHIRRFSAFVNNIGKDENEEKNSEDLYHYYSPNVRLEKKGKCHECCCFLNQYYICVFDHQQIHLRIPLNEVICCHPISSVLKKKKKFGLILGCISIGKKKFFKFEVETKDEIHEDDLVKNVQQVSFLGEIREGFEGLDSKKRRILVLINPVSGAKKSVPIFEDDIRPIFEICHFTFETIVTKYAGHATDICKNLDTTKYTEIVSVGGDGLLFEIVQGLFQHPRLPFEEIKKIPLSLIPTGTGNGLSWCMGSNLSPVLAALITARGRTVPYNVVSVITPKERVFSFLFFAYGVIPDVDLGYKSFKWMGDFKYVVGGALSCVNRTRYPLQMKYVQLEGETRTPQDPYVFPTDFGNVYGTRILRILNENEAKKDPPLTLLERHFGEELKNMMKNHKTETSKRISKNDDDDEEYPGEEEEEEEGENEQDEDDEINSTATVVKEINEPQFYLCVGNARKFSVDFWGAGRASPGNGYVDLIWCEKVGFLESLSVFRKMVGKEPDFLDETNVISSARIKAFYFVPKGPNFSILDVDGEEMEISPVMGMVHKGLLSVCHLEVPWT